MRLIPLLLLAAATGLAQDTVTIHVNAAETAGPFTPIYRYFGYDEPNYTYMKNGRKLVGRFVQDHKNRLSGGDVETRRNPAAKSHVVKLPVFVCVCESVSSAHGQPSHQPFKSINPQPEFVPHFRRLPSDFRFFSIHDGSQDIPCLCRTKRIQ